MSTAKPAVRVIGTGGSIAGVGPDRMDYIQYAELGRLLTIRQSLDRIPEVNGVATVRSEDLFSVGSTLVGPPEWLLLSQRINEIFRDEIDVAGVAVTHGTATLEETAYFLHLTVKSSKPVVVTGAMRPSTAVSTDGDLNLLDAVRIAAWPDASAKGVLTVLNNEIQCARDVTKTNTYRVETFNSPQLGLLGYADSDGQVVFYRLPIRKHTTDAPFEADALSSLPRVDIVHTYAGADGMLVEAVRNNRSDGMVLAGSGGGSCPPAQIAAAAAAVRDGMPVVLASRSTAGRVIMTPKKQEQGFIVSDNLSPQKARVLLMLGLTITSDRQQLQQMFLEY